MIWRKIKYILRKIDRFIRWFIRSVIGDATNTGKINRFYNWFRFRLWGRYDKVNPRSLDAGYYREPGTRILHSAFECLLQFWENNKPYETIVMDDNNKELYDKAKELYVWWKWERDKEWEWYREFKDYYRKFRPERETTTKEKVNDEGETEEFLVIRTPDEDEKTPEEKRYQSMLDKSCEIEQYLHEKDKEKLKELAEIRRILWT